MSHNANGSTSHQQCSTHMFLSGTIGAMLIPTLPTPLSLMPTDHQSTSIVQRNTRSHQQLQLMNLLPHPLHTSAQHCIPRSFPSPRPEVVNVRGNLGNSSSPDRIFRHAEMAQRESEIDRQRRKSREDAAAARAYPGKERSYCFSCGPMMMAMASSCIREFLGVK